VSELVSELKYQKQMKKLKSKKRKYKQTQPPKPQAAPTERKREVSELRPEFDARPANGASHGNPIGTQKFHELVAAIQATRPNSLEPFATYDLRDLKQRRWLTRYCIKKETGELPSWQQVALENAGYNWVRGRKPPAKHKADAPRSNSREVAWTQAYESLREVCAEAPNPTMAMMALLHADDVHHDWLRKQAVAIRAGKLKPERIKRLRALPFNFNDVLADRAFRQWRSRFKAYASGELKNADRWEAIQRCSKQAGTLPRWRINALKSLNFDWSMDYTTYSLAGIPNEEANLERMEARWRAKLEQYLALEATHGKPLSMMSVDPKQLRPWLSRIREHYKKGQLRPELIAEFEAKGFEFSGADYRQQLLDSSWDQQFETLQKFKERFGHVHVPSTFQDDPELGSWLGHQRERLTKGTLKGENRARLKAIGVKWQRKLSPRKPAKVHISAWLNTFRQIEAILKAEHGGQMPLIGHFPQKHRTWLQRQRDKIQASELEAWQLEQLDAIGFDPNRLPTPPPQVDWQERLERLRRYVKANGDARVARSCPDSKLYAFVQRVRQRKRNNDLSAEELRELNEAGFCFDPLGEVSLAWMQHYETLKSYRHTHGDCQVPRMYTQQGIKYFRIVQSQWRRIDHGKEMDRPARILLPTLPAPPVSQQPRACPTRGRF
jgi:hypothetical protein